MTEDLDNTIRNNAYGSKRDSGSVEQHSLADQIAAGKHLAGRQAAGQSGLGTKRVKLSLGGIA